MSRAGVQPQRPKDLRGQHVPVVITLDGCMPAVIGPYCQAIIASLQALHPGTQLLLTPLIPSSHALPTHPFLPPGPFLASLPALLRRPARPESTVWRSSSGLLRSITTARRLLEGPIGGVGSDKRGSLPRYVVVISGTDLESKEGEDLWLEDEDPTESWHAVSASFTKGPHMTTLFSLISLAYTPNLEAFWKASSSRFPANLVFTSITPPHPGNNFNFPLYASSHACFLVGFYNSRNANPSATSTPTPQSAVGSPASNAAKRVAPVDAQAASKKQKPNVPVSAPPPLSAPPAASSAQAVQQYLSTQAQSAIIAKQAQAQQGPPQIQAQQPNLAQRAAQAALAGQQGRPTVPTIPGTTSIPNEHLQQYITEMKAAASRPGGAPLNLAEVQAAMSNYAGGAQLPNPNSNPLPPPNRPPSASQQQPTANQRSQQVLHQQQLALQQQQQAMSAQQQQQRQALANLRPQNLTPQQLNQLPQLSPDMRAKIEAHYAEIRNRVTAGQITQEEANLQIKRLQDLAAQHRITLATNSLQNKVLVDQARQQHQLGANQANRPRLPSQPQPNQYASQQVVAAQQLQQQQQQHALQYASVPPPPPHQRQDSNEGGIASPIWRGAISWSVGEGAVKHDCVLYCAAAPLQASAIRDLADVKLPPALRVSNLLPLKMSDLQELSLKHTLPAVALSPIPNDALRPELRERLLKMSGGTSNDELYTLLAQSMEHRTLSGIIRFPEAPNTGMVIVSMPKQGRFIGIVFTKIPIPDQWLNAEVGSVPQLAKRQAPPLQQQLPLPQAYPPQFQQQAPLGGMSYEQLSNLLGPEQLAQILAQGKPQQQ